MQEKFYLTEKLPPYIFAKIYDLKKEAIANGLDIIDFGMGNPDSAPPTETIEELSRLVLDPSLYGYSITGGIDRLKKAICGYYQSNFAVELDYQTESMVTIGSKEGIASLATAIADSDNYICVPSPSYPIHTFAFGIAKSKTVHIEAIKPEDFLIKFKSFVENASHKPIAVIVSYPCNPTTETASIEFYQELVRFCTLHKIYIISDIAYCEIYFSAKDKPSSILQVARAKDIAIEFSSVSKSFCLAGTRVGFACGNKNLINALFKIKSYLDYGSFTPLQLIAAKTLESNNQQYLERLRKTYDDRGRFLIETFKNYLDWEIEKPKTSMFIWTKLPKFATDKDGQMLSSFEFCKELVLKAGIAFSPGSSFGKNGDGFIRISLIVNEEKVAEAAKRIAKIYLDK